MRNKTVPMITTLIHRAEKQWIRDIRRGLISADVVFTKGVIYGLREAKRIVQTVQSEAR